MTRAVETISHYFALVADALESHWALGDDKGGYLCTNLGIRALLQLLRRLIAFVEIKDQIRATTVNPPISLSALSHSSTHSRHILSPPTQRISCAFVTVEVRCKASIKIVFR